MEILETTTTVIDGKVIIEVPHSFDNQDVKIVISQETDDEEDWANLPAIKRVEILKEFYGADKFPDAKVGKYDVYYQ